PSEYVGYHELKANGVLKDIIIDNELVDTVPADSRAQVIFDKTPFYAEMGGQVADKGVIKNQAGEVVAEVEDVQHAPNGQNMHTKTHLLEQEWRDDLRSHTHQAGSLVEPTYLRFDCTNLGAVTAENLKKIEDSVNAKIWENIQVETVVTDKESAEKMGAIALF